MKELIKDRGPIILICISYLMMLPGKEEPIITGIGCVGLIAGWVWASWGHPGCMGEP